MTAGTVGSSVNHFGFLVKSIQEWMPKWQAAGLKMEPVTGPRVYLIGPDDVLEIVRPVQGGSR